MWKLICIVVCSFAPTTKETLGVYSSYEEAVEHCPEDMYQDDGTNWKDTKYIVCKYKQDIYYAYT